MQWMLDIQFGRRNLSPIQRIAVAEKYRPIYERQAKENISKAVSELNKNRTNPTLPQLVNMKQNLLIQRKNLQKLLVLVRKLIVWEQRFLIQIMKS